MLHCFPPEFRMAFAAVDKRDTGVISFKELATVLQHIGEPVSDIELKKMATQCDFESKFYKIYPRVKKYIGYPVDMN